MAMKVEWSISEMAIDAWSPGFLAKIYHDGFDKFKATVSSRDHPHTVILSKLDNSLIELMNWVEEELKFRSSHAT